MMSFWHQMPTWEQSDLALCCLLRLSFPILRIRPVTLTLNCILLQLLYHDRSPGVDYSYDIPYNFDRAGYPKLNTEESERHLANDQQSPVDSPEPSSHQHTAAFAGGSELSGSHRSPSSARAPTPDERSALTDTKSYYSSSKTRTTGTYQSAQTYRRRTDGETDRRNSSRRRPIFSSDFKRAR